MNVVNWLLALFGVERRVGERCELCVRFDDHRGFTSLEPDEVDGYCLNDWNGEYSGHFTHSSNWCAMFKRREP